MKYNYKLDQVRIWASIAVVLIHVTSYLPNLGRETLENYYWYRPILKLGVPFFFGVSGYLLNAKEDAFVRRYCRNISFRFIIYSLFYVLVDGLILLSLHQNLLQAASAWLNERNLYSFFNGTWGQYHLWFLFALIFASYGVGKLLQWRWDIRYIFFLCLSLNAVIWLTPRSEFLDMLFRYGGIPKAMLYISLGAMAVQHPPKIRIQRWHILLSGVIYGLLFNFSQFNLFNEVALVALTYLLLAYVIQRPGEYSWLNRWSSMSLDIYVLHVLFLKIVKLYGEAKLWNWFNSDLLYILVLMLVCVLGSILIYPLVNRFFFDPLEQLLKLNLEE